MTLVVGYAPDGRGGAVLDLAGMLARSAQDDLVVCAVVPSPWPQGSARGDSEDRTLLDRMADAALGRARARLASDVAAAFLVRHARSAPAGLLEVAEQRQAAMIVIGMSGHPAIGSVTARLLHSSPMPVALAPHGLRLTGDGNITVAGIDSQRLTVDLSGTGNIEATGTTTKLDVTISQAHHGERSMTAGPTPATDAVSARIRCATANVAKRPRSTGLPTNRCSVRRPCPPARLVWTRSRGR